MLFTGYPLLYLLQIVPSIKLGPEEWACPFCDKTMRKKYHMDEHIRTHTGESFGCPDCPYSTAKKSNLNRHMKKQHNTTISDVIKDDGKK